MGFMNEHFLLRTLTSQSLYAKVKNLEIIDFHCHLSPQEIFEDKPFENIVDLWLAGDHYKWRSMRAQGISEKNITGDASSEVKFKSWAETVENLVGNPLYHWTHLEMREVFGITENLNQENWQKIYDEMNHQIIKQALSPRKLIQRSRVSFIGTTDHPLDSLEYHKRIKEDKTFDVMVAPTFRPDEAFVSHRQFPEFVQRLAAIIDQPILNYQDFLEGLEIRVNFFVENGCRATDHSFQEVIYQPATLAEVNRILEKARNKETLTISEKNKWQSKLFLDLCRIYHKNDLVTQLHFGALRDNNDRGFNNLGGDAGFDSMGDQENLGLQLNGLLNELDKTNQLPKMIVYNLNPTYNVLVANTLANFQGNEEGIQGKLQFGAAWWFNDTKQGMLNQMMTMADQGLLAHFIGMLTDSRSFLSYQRHDYFRRILCNLIGEWVESGEMPNEESYSVRLVEKIANKNAKNYFGV